MIAKSRYSAQGSRCTAGSISSTRAVASGHWLLIRYDPIVRAADGNPFLLDWSKPRMQLSDCRKGELRLRALTNTDPAEAERLQNLTQQTVWQRWQISDEMATRSASDFSAYARKDH